MKAALCISGIVLFFASLWIGGWAVGAYGLEHWSNLPTIVTTFLLCFVGIGLAISPFVPENAP